MLRVACRDDIDRAYVVRVRGMTVLFRPTLADTALVRAQTAHLLTDEEQAMIRAAHGVTADEAEGVLVRRWPVACPCAVPQQLRCEKDSYDCPLHVPIYSLVG